MAFVLSWERLCYVWIWHNPDRFSTLWASLLRRRATDPVLVVRVLFGLFKVIQIAAFAWWCHAFGGGSFWPTSPPVMLVGAAALLVALGQVLNIAVFRGIGLAGVFYGARFGRNVAWSERFPFSWFRHPQYVGTVLTIWGVFLFMRFPHDDWILVPALETVYYALGAHFEQSSPRKDEGRRWTW